MRYYSERSVFQRQIEEILTYITDFLSWKLVIDLIIRYESLNNTGENYYLHKPKNICLYSNTYSNQFQRRLSEFYRILPYEHE